MCAVFKVFFSSQRGILMRLMRFTSRKIMFNTFPIEIDPGNETSINSSVS